MLSWRLCLKLGKPMVIAEDDVILATKLKETPHAPAEQDEEPSFLLLGWNGGSLLRAELERGFGLISLFEKAYPKEEELTRLVNYRKERHMQRALNGASGLPAYRITPITAQIFAQSNSIHWSVEEIPMGRGIPTHFSETLDGALNNQYEKIGAEVIFPPLALALNNQNESLTRKTGPENFHGSENLN